MGRVVWLRIGLRPAGLQEKAEAKLAGLEAKNEEQREKEVCSFTCADLNQSALLGK